MEAASKDAMFKDLLFNLQSQEVKFIDMRFTQLDGVEHTITYRADCLTQDHYFNGFKADVLGFKGAMLAPDMATSFLDPFAVEKTLVIRCNIANYSTEDPRRVASKAMGYVSENGLSEIKFLINSGFHIFDDVRFGLDAVNSFVKIDSYEFSSSGAKKYEAGNNAYRSANNHTQTQPIDTLHDIRSEIAVILESIGMHPMHHYHGSSAAQCNLSYESNDLLDAADGFVNFKYITKNIVNSYGKTVTFMPKPVIDAIGAGLYIEQGMEHENAHYYLGGITKHIKAINAFSNPIKNSYRRLVLKPEIKVQPVEENGVVRLLFPDPSANPYLLLPAIVMAGIDGIKNKLEPDYSLNLAASLDEALSSLDKDRAFLCAGDVFDSGAIDKYIAMQRCKLAKYNEAVSALDFALDYTC